MSVPSYESFGLVNSGGDWVKGPGCDLTHNGTMESFYGAYNSPWVSKGTPDTVVSMQQLFDYGDVLIKYDPVVKQAIERVIAYFLTDYELYDPTHTGKLRAEEVNNYREILDDQLSVMSNLSLILLEYIFYGNSFVTMLCPIKRRLQCPACKVIHPVEVVIHPDNKKYFRFRYVSKGAHFTAICPNCQYKGNWVILDNEGDFSREVNYQIWNQRQFIITIDPISNRRQYIWKFPSTITRRVQDGDPMVINSMPQSMMKAIGDGKDYRFNDDQIFHMCEPTPSALQSEGWGVGRIVYSYGASRYMFGLRKVNEAIAQDYIVPMRVISPTESGLPDSSFATDTAGTYDLSKWSSSIKSMIAAHRRDPNTIHVVGKSFDYNVLGGEAGNMVTAELMANGEDMQLNSIGVPPQFYRTNLELQTAPMSARMLESHWRFLVTYANKFLRWTVKKVSPRLGWRPVGIKLTAPHIADNLDHLMLLQAMLERGAVADTTLLKRLGLVFEEEKRLQRDEAEFTATQEAESQADIEEGIGGSTMIAQTAMDNQAMLQQYMSGGGAPPAGGMPPEGDPNAPPAPGSPAAMAPLMAQIGEYGSPTTPTSPQQMAEMAKSLAAQLVYMPEGQKRQALKQIEQQNPVLKDLVVEEMDKYRQQVRSQSYDQAMAQGPPPQ